MLLSIADLLCVTVLQAVMTTVPSLSQGDRGYRGEKGKRGDRGEAGDAGATGPLVLDFVFKTIQVLSRKSHNMLTANK